MTVIRKPHNLVTAYWDDIEYFLQQAEAAEVLKGPEPADILFPTQKRGMRFTILSSFLFLEAFINAEYFDEMGFKNGPTSMTETQKYDLDNSIMNTYFDDKWSTWIEKICQNGKQSLKGTKEFQEIRKLKDWRNHLTHYKIHSLLLVASDIETIENAREAAAIVVRVLRWYYVLTRKEVPEWINRDIFKVQPK
ncbi:hypothetical protein [Chitinophaga sp. RAB17]|uniref:hypothetical protein n=1 Tax=Chitinophaga sp. RAB17 TaxID=3233049 RepID=UPI003F91E0C6